MHLSCEKNDFGNKKSLNGLLLIRMYLKNSQKEERPQDIINFSWKTHLRNRVKKHEFEK